jgi:raffinose/stachyose/melibiose transport system permease protein
MVMTAIRAQDRRMVQRRGRTVTRLGFAGILLRLLVWGILLTLVLVVVIPLIWMVLSSLKVNQQFLSDPFGLPTSIDLGNYVDAWNLGIGQYLINSVIVTIASIIATTLISAWAAFGLTKLTMPFSRTVLFLIVGGLMLAPTVALIPLLRILQSLGIYDTLLGLVVLYTAFRIPFTTFLIRSYMVDLPHEVDEAARLDGCSRAQQFWRLAFPMSMPIIISSIILQCLFAWNEYLFAFIFVSSTSTMTLPVGLANLSSRLSTDYPMVFAGMTISALPMIVFFFAGQRFFVRGLAEGIGK